MDVLGELVNNKLVSIEIIYDHLALKFSSGNSVVINNNFDINFDGLVKLLNKKLLRVIDVEQRFQFFFENDCLITVDMTDSGYNCPEALEIFIKKYNELVVWS